MQFVMFVVLLMFQFELFYVFFAIDVVGVVVFFGILALDVVGVVFIVVFLAYDFGTYEVAGFAQVIHTAGDEHLHKSNMVRKCHNKLLVVAGKLSKVVVSGLRGLRMFLADPWFPMVPPKSMIQTRMSLLVHGTVFVKSCMVACP